MNENKIIAWIYTLLTLAIAGVATAFRFVLERYYIESGTGMYKIGTNTPEAFNLFLVVSVIVLVAMLFMFRRDSLSGSLCAIPVITSIIAGVCAIALIFSGVIYLMQIKNGLAVGFGGAFIHKIKFIGALVSFPAGVYYFLSILSGKTVTKSLSGLSFFPLIWTWIYLLGIYFDHTAEMGTPSRVLLEIALITLMLYQLMETRTLVGKAKPMVYLLISAIAVVFLCPAMYPTVYTWISRGGKLDLDVLYAAYGLACALYIFSRMIGLAIKYSRNTEKKIIKNLMGKKDIFSDDEQEDDDVQPDIECFEEIHENVEPIAEIGEAAEEPVQTEEPVQAEEVEQVEGDGQTENSEQSEKMVIEPEEVEDKKEDVE